MTRYANYGRYFITYQINILIHPKTKLRFNYYSILYFFTQGGVELKKKDNDNENIKQRQAKKKYYYM